MESQNCELKFNCRLIKKQRVRDGAHSSLIRATELRGFPRRALEPIQRVNDQYRSDRGSERESSAENRYEYAPAFAFGTVAMAAAMPRASAPPRTSPRT